MNIFISAVLLSAVAFASLTSALQAAVSPEKAASTVILNETGVQNLKIQTVEAEETDFEETVFALGRIQAIPEKRAVVASRVAGRIMEINTTLGTLVEAGADVVRLESRQSGNPPPSLWLKAPTSGLVTSSEARIGEPVDPDKAILEITDLSEIYAVARLPEHLAGKIKAGASAHIHVSALPEEVFEGTLLRFGTAADSASGTIDAVFSLPNPSLLLRPNLRAEFSIVLSKREAVMSIPKSALQGDALSRFVYIKDYDLPHAFVKSPVQIGATNDRFAEVLGGLIVGDEVVTRGAYSLAFAGKGSISLKEALDAAHGHEHNEDGSEVSSALVKTPRTGFATESAHTSAPLSMLTLFSLASNGLLLLLLLLAAIRNNASSSAADNHP
ncbi:MAG: Multidrug efflux pump subunit AcrA (membrane-fusion protein) [Verrucomicrobia bacterium]|nr:MAG: Multidrug efflux pump subunit AcrA (membrane-fusion protein) [Verrucomicrobiota bacterium]